MKQNLLKIIFFISTLILTTSCMKAQSSIESSTQQAADAIGCANFKSLAYDSMYTYLDKETTAPSLEDFSASLNKKIDALVEQQKINQPEQVDELKRNMTSLYRLLIEEAAKLKQTKTAKEHLQTLIEMEMQDTSTDSNIRLNSMSAQQFAKVQATAQDLSVSCQAPDSSLTQPGNELGNPAPVNKTRMLAGSHNAFATAYQSCQTLQLPEVSAETPTVLGITRLAQGHPDGVGGRRVVSDVKKVQETHPYIKVAGGTQAGCFNVRGNPLIYDYGGSPGVNNNTINFFQDAGSGTQALGVDCSAYVSSAIAAAGLKYRPDVGTKAIYIRQTSSKFINAKTSGFTCFKNPEMTPVKSLVPGDIVGVNGHVVIVDRVGSDPFGLKKLNSISQCNSLSVDQFDFSVSQSSPSKGGIGLNIYKAKDYLKESGKMSEAFIGLGKAACEAYFGQKTVATPSSSYGLLRHLGTPECISEKIQLANQSCVSQCLQ